jgi:predicted metal-dependent phosphoesterase TrpH
VDSVKTLEETKARLEASGIPVVGLTDHTIFKSIYFFDPNGHRVELTCVTGTEAQLRNLKEIAPAMLEEWSKTKLPPRQAAWLHESEFSKK